jgi:hypothetical protein
LAGGGVVSVKYLYRVIFNRGVFIVLMCLLSFNSIKANPENNGFYLRGAFYQDWMGYIDSESNFYHRLSSRLKLKLGEKPGQGWTLFIDLRNRFKINENSSNENQLIIYDFRLDYEKQDKKFYFSLGQMNLYDRAGVGVLLGAVAGYRINKYISIGGYGGIEPDIYNTRWDTDYRKFGVFAKYVGPKARNFTLSYNVIRFIEEEEREYLYFSGLVPLKSMVILYGNVEYDLGDHIPGKDRLSRIFLNLRTDIGEYVDILANYSSGKGLDYHQYLINVSKDPSLTTSEIERYFYSTMYGLRLSVKPFRNFRFFVGRRESEQQDKGIKNHTTLFGFSGADVLNIGVSLHASYHLNRGDLSESNYFYVSASRRFGGLYGSLSYSSSYKGIRYRFIDGAPLIVDMDDRSSISTSWFYTFNRHLAMSFQYEYTFEENSNEHLLFLRLIIRK